MIKDFRAGAAKKCLFFTIRAAVMRMEALEGSFSVIRLKQFSRYGKECGLVS